MALLVVVECNFQETRAWSFPNMDVINVGVSLQREDQTNDVSSWQESGHRVHQRPDETDRDGKKNKTKHFLAVLTLSSSPTFEYFYVTVLYF